ncbi:MAG: hypothetical protein LBG15_02775 [Dysgonamonadaceae bacterium]|nr:hypothetical protein [Dysgonamonadaceae bacterium]
MQRTGKDRISSVEIVENKALTAEIIGGIDSGRDYAVMQVCFFVSL